ncbi:MAG: hypothetical protein DBX59_05175 [Bacillota bacterium]|nr:MAG: hypothetical protein DBX59_05175 [Bacillota bacterium]
MISYVEENKKDGKCYLFFDEIQTLDGWQDACKTLRLYNYSLFITGCPLLYEYVETWLNTVKAPKIKRKSLNVLKSAFTLYIKPVIKDKPLNKVRTPEMLKAIENCPYSYMRQVVYNVLRAVFKRAYQYDLIEENPAEKLDFVYHKRKKGHALTRDEQTAFLQAIQDEPTRPLWLFYLLSGVRCQEALTILWEDIDSEHNRIFIRGTKTETSERYIPLFPQISEILQEIPRTGAKVFPYTYRAVQCAFYRIRKKSGLQFRIHDLRHTFATRCLESGITTKTVSKWLGHKHTSTTDEIYSHLLTEFERTEIAKFNPKI